MSTAPVVDAAVGDVPPVAPPADSTDTPEKGKGKSKGMYPVPFPSSFFSSY